MWKDYFDFTWSERIAIRILLGIITLFLIWRVFYSDDRAQVPGDFADLRAAITAFEDSLNHQEELRLAELESSKSRFSDYTKDKATAALDDRPSQGKIAQEKISQENAGLYFDKKIKSDDGKPTFTQKFDTGKSDFKSHTGDREYNFVELNQCKDSDLQQLPGIAAVLSKRILTYREKLGGFYDSQQLNEVYGLKPETFTLIKEYITANPALVKKISINFAGREEFAAHPYIGKSLSTRLLDYRNKTGFINSLEQLVTDSILPDSLYRKLSPYLKTD